MTAYIKLKFKTIFLSKYIYIIQIFFNGHFLLYSDTSNNEKTIVIMFNGKDI